MLMLLCAMTAWAWELGGNITSLESLNDGDYVCFKNVGRNKYVYEATDKKIDMIFTEKEEIIING